ncbi:fibronectin type III domain-containing protein, partial [Candidatus Uhrbacteria bacterium]|nr:fibronectin type III domain-containing protein [Candidatus Uhrbacteria bacterium]
KNGASSFSSEEGITVKQCAPPPPPPPTPKIPDAPAGTSLYMGKACNELVFRWTAVADADGYEIFRDNQFFAKVHAGTIVYTVVSVPRTTQYTYQVRAFNAVGASPLTVAKLSPAIICNLTPPPPPPSQPTRRAPDAPGNLRATAIACTKVYAQWDDVADEDGYELLRNGQVVQRTAANATSVTDAQAQEGTPYTYTVRAVNTTGASSAPTGVSVATPTCPTAPPPITQGQPPQTPKFSQVTQIDCRTFLIRWDDIVGEDGYSLLRDGIVLQQTGPNVTTFTDTSLVPSFQYRYSIRAFNRFGDSPQSQPLIFKTGTCANVQVPPPPPPPVVAGTTTNCAQIGGTTCATGEICESRWLDTQGDNRCCASACQKYQAAQRCNYNSICEPQERDACSDCQCRGGVICGGLCYGGLADDAECVQETLVHKVAKRPTQGTVYCSDATQCGANGTCLLPGPCTLSAIPIKVTVQLPTQLEVGVWTPGTMTFLNTWTTTLPNHIYFETSGMDIEISLQQNSTPVPLPRDWDLVQFQPNVPVTYTIRARMHTLSDGITATHQLKRATLDLRFFPNATANLTKSFYGFTRATAQSCGQYLWNMNGQCLGSIWYAGANCTSGANCIGRINDWGAIIKTYPAKGTYAVLVMTAGLTTQQQATYSANTLIGFGQETRAFFTREAERIVGRPMVDLTFTFDNHYPWTIPDPQLQFLQGKQTVREYLESKIGRALPQQQYPFIMIAIPHLPGPSGYGYSEVAGMYHVGQGVILVRAAAGILQPQVLAHEFSHAFGCQDWFNGSGRENRFFLCNERRANNLLCAAETAVPGLQWFTRITQGYTTLFNRTLDDCAAEMGWGDMDNDGKVDIDPSIAL